MVIRWTAHVARMGSVKDVQTSIRKTWTRPSARHRLRFGNNIKIVYRVAQVTSSCDRGNKPSVLIRGDFIHQLDTYWLVNKDLATFDYLARIVANFHPCLCRMRSCAELCLSSESPFQWSTARWE
jgi:hypothetical protein